jgi:phosphoribosylformimino-5-aminoimidazole carboxamide ribotide isomerase
MDLWPAIDLLDGRAVRLHQGKYDQVTVYFDDPVAHAESWGKRATHLHVVDLEGARSGRPAQQRLVGAIIEAFRGSVQVGGGVRDADTVKRYLDLGAERVVLGTASIRDPDLVRRVALAYPGKIVLALDAKDGSVATDGWLEVSTRTAVDVVRDLGELPIAAILYTDIARDGMRVGPNFDATARLAKEGAPVLASGGVATVDDLRRLARLPGVAGAIVGKALYEKAFTLEQALEAAGDPGRAAAGRD